MPHFLKHPITGCRHEQFFGPGHVGMWMIDADTLEGLRQRTDGVDLSALSREFQVDVVANGVAEALADWEGGVVEARLGHVQAAPKKPYHLANGVATLNISGPTTKYPHSFQRLFGGTSTVLAERALRVARTDPEVKGGMLHFEDCPGGAVAGAPEFVKAIRSFAQAKPIRAHGTDTCCSAGYLYGSACDHFTANATGHVGSIGVRTALVDTSKQAEQKGVRVIPIAVGKFKTLGMPGTEITKEQVAEVQRLVDAMGDMFFDTVAQHRPALTKDELRALEARVFHGREAVGLKLIDGVASFEEAHEDYSRHLHDKYPSTSGGHVQGTNFLPAFNGSTDMTLLDQLRAMVAAGPAATEADILASVQQRIAAATTTQNSLTAANTELATLRADNQRLNAELTQLRAAKPEAAGVAMPAAEILGDLVDFKGAAIDAMVNNSQMVAPVANALKDLCGIPQKGQSQAPKANAFMFAKVEALGGKRPVDAFMALHIDAKGQTTTPRDGTQTPVQAGVNDLTRTLPAQGNAATADEIARINAQADADVARFKAERGVYDGKAAGAAV